jgi:ABC-type sugar transport system ATPase subunit
MGVAVAQAAAFGSHLIIMDEPTAHELMAPDLALSLFGNCP